MGLEEAGMEACKGKRLKAKHIEKMRDTSMIRAMKNLSSENQQDSKNQQGARGSQGRRQCPGRKDPQQACLEGIPAKQWSIGLQTQKV